MSADFLSDLASFALQHDLLTPGPMGPEALAVAVSGGVDSVTLMHALVRLGHRPQVISFDHGLRAESEEELRLVEAQARALGLPFQGRALALGAGAELAARARAARYAALSAQPQPHIAIAHHLDDQVETVLDRLARGSGARGLSGIAARRGRYVRPLLFATRARVQAWAEAQGLRWVEDPSNRKGTRGALRAEVLPALERIRRGATGAIARSARLLAMDDALLFELAAPLVTADGVTLEPWRAASEPLRRRALSLLVERSRGPAQSPSAAQLDAALGLSSTGQVVELSGQWRLIVDGPWVKALPPPPGPETLHVGRWGIWQVDADAPVRIRPPQPGERVAGQRLVERLRRAQVPTALRPYHPVFEREGRLWVPGLDLPPWPEGRGTSHLRCHRIHSPSVPGGGPFSVEL